MRARIVISTVAQLGSQVLTAGIAVILIRLFTRNLGNNDYGIYATAFAFVTTFSLVTDLGLNGITDIISNNMTLRLILSVGFVPFVWAIGYGLYPHGQGTLHSAILLFSLDLVLDSCKSVSLSLFVAQVRSEVVATLTIVNQLLFVGMAWGALTLHWGVLGVVWAYLASDAIVAVCSLIAVRRHIPIRIQFQLSEWRIIAALSLPLGVIQVVNMVYLKADSIIISVIKGPTDVGYYGVAYSVIGVLLSIPTYIMTALSPTMATTRDLTSIVQKAVDVMIFLALPIGVGGVLLRSQFIFAIARPSFRPAEMPFAILVASMVVTYLSIVVGYACVAADKHQKIVRAAIFTMFVNIVLNLGAVPLWGIDGAAGVTVVTEMLSVSLNYSIFRRETGVHVHVRPMAYRQLLASALLIPIALAAKPLWATGIDILNPIIGSVVLGVSYLAIILVLRALPPEAVTALAAVRRRLSFGS
jgi:O-antigen/teichoic acid export membrane protein